MNVEAVDTYDRLKQEAWDAATRGEFRDSQALLDQALSLAQDCGDSARVDRTLCSRAAVQIELGETTTGTLSELRQILLGSRDSESRYLAAYTLARAHDVDNETERALFYARIANRQASESGTAEQLSSSHNLIGSLLTARSEFDSAFEELQKAIKLLPPAELGRRATALENRGYCQAMRGRYRKAFRDLFESLRLSVRLKARSLEASARLSLAYTYLLCERYGRAIRHSTRSLALTESCEDRIGIKRCLFVLGEAHKLAGNPLAARSYFRRLQEQFYPEAPNVPDLLLLLNVKSLVNLRA